MDTHPIPSTGAADAANGRRKASQNTWITTTQLAAELGVHPRTLARWLRDGAMGFPRPRVVNKRNYFERDAVDAWKTATAVKAAGGR
jgi:excisionase family DNA binding protein